MLPYLFLVIITIAGVNCQCNDGYVSVGHCKFLHDALESALLTPRNLYLLRETFKPTSYQSPTVVLITYKVRFDKETSKFEIGWSSSGFFSLIDPVTLSAFQSGMVLQFLGPQLFPLHHNIKLVLDVRTSLPALMTKRPKFKHVLNTLTTRLKAYAATQGKLIHWDGSDKGFIWERPKTYENIVRLLIPVAIITLVVLVIVVMLTTSVRKGLARVSGNRVFGIIFWGSFLTVGGIIYWELFYSVKFNNAIFTAYPHIHTLKLVVDLMPIGLGVIVGIGPSLWVGCTTPVPTPLFLTVNNKMQYSLALVMYYIFILLITVRALPTLLLAFVYPLEVISTIVLATATIVSFILLYTPFFLLFESLLSCNFTHCTKNAHIMCYSLLSFLVVVFVVWVNYLNIYVLRIGTNTSGVSQALFSLISSFVLAMCGYFMKRMFFGKKSMVTLIKEGNANNTQEKEASTTHENTQTDNADPELQPLVDDAHVDTEL